jgi:hypothetical protein
MVRPWEISATGKVKPAAPSSSAAHARGFSGMTTLPYATVVVQSVSWFPAVEPSPFSAYTGIPDSFCLDANIARILKSRPIE